VPTRLLHARTALRTTRRRWLIALVLVGIGLVSAWVSLTVTPAATIRAGVEQAQIKAAPGTGTVVRTALGRAVTDDALNSGPLQVQVDVDVHRHRQVTEPQLWKH
jgi:hypothetical protein